MYNIIQYVETLTHLYSGLLLCTCCVSRSVNEFTLYNALIKIWINYSVAYELGTWISIYTKTFLSVSQLYIQFYNNIFTPKYSEILRSWINRIEYHAFKRTYYFVCYKFIIYRHLHTPSTYHSPSHLSTSFSVFLAPLTLHIQSLY